MAGIGSQSSPDNLGRAKMALLTMVAELMEIAARTAPKARGDDYIVVRTLEGPQLQLA